MLDGHRKTTEEEGQLYCKEYIPEIAGTYDGAIGLIGGGKYMWEDYYEFKHLFKETKYDTMATNIAAMFIPDLTHMFSLHYKSISYLKKWRDVEYGRVPNKPLCHSCKAIDGVDYVWYLAMRACTSGFMMVPLSWLLGYRKIVLIGIPMDDSGYFYKPFLNSTFTDKFRSDEITWLKEKYGDNIRSMSGKTADVLGTPTKEWIKEKTYAC